MIPSHIAGYPIVLPEHRHRFHTEHPNWHKAWLDSIHESLKPDDVVIDVGAEQGDLSALVASWVPDGGVVLVEPQPDYWPTIWETFNANDLRPLFGFNGFADSDSEKGQGGFSLFGKGTWPGAAVKPVDDLEIGFYHLNEHQHMARITLDKMLETTDAVPSVFLIDAEGAELRVLRGAPYQLAAYKPLVWCAVHPEIMRDRYGHDPNELLAFMHRMGYRWDFLGFQGELHFKFSPR